MTLKTPANTRNAIVVLHGEIDSNFDDCTLVKNSIKGLDIIVKLKTIMCYLIVDWYFRLKGIHE